MNFHTIKMVKPLENNIIEVIFINGVNKKYDVKPLIEKYDLFKELHDIALFNKVKVDIGGYAVIWNEKIDLSCEEIWENGIIEK